MRARVPIPEDPTTSRMHIWAFVLLKFLLPKPKATHIGLSASGRKPQMVEFPWSPFKSAPRLLSRKDKTGHTRQMRKAI